MLNLPDPAAIASLPQAELPATLTHLAALQTAIAARLAERNGSVGNGTISGGTNDSGPKGLLDVRQAAERLGMSPDWLYRHAKRLPFTCRVGRRAVKFDSRGLDRWIAARSRR
jgi:predicted DNA-binding transcriptional regulator AlpA